MADAAEQPAFDLLGVRVFAHRVGDHVTGRVEFPEAFRRAPVPLDYQSRRPREEPDSTGQPSFTTPRTARRHRAVDAHLEALGNRGDLPKTTVTARVALRFKVSLRSLQLWTRKFETEGSAGLVDRYSTTPSKVIICCPARGLDAMRICAWWSFRIGNLACIDHRATHTALDLLNRGFAVADVLATIDRYFSYSCDRTRMPFKAFSKWVRYDFEKWLHRACADAEYLREVTESRGRDPVPLQAPETRRPARMPGVRTRRRLANNRATRAGIARLDRAPDETPETVTEAVQNLDDGYRAMLWRAAKRDRQAREEAIATLPLWWSTMPQTVRHNIEAQTEAWSTDHPGASAAHLVGRKVDMFLTALRRDRVGPQRLHVAQALNG